ncbi:MAG: hypothetical protein NTW49_09925 [Bacteroidia bacterium]|nr:hypothetical protein [Bacteroidia bacterium]
MNLFKFVQRIWIINTKGAYSQEYINFFKKNNGFHPYNTCLKNSLTHYLIQFFRKNTTIFPIQEEIKFGDIPFGFNFTKLFKMKGIPNCFNIDPIDNAILKVLRYSEKVPKSNMNATYFFLNDKFFLGEYRFGDITFINLPDVIKTLSKRYKVELPETSEEFLIVDPNGVIIHYLFNGIAASIRYFSNVDNEIRQVINNYMNVNVKEEDENLESVLSQHF